MVHTRGVVGLGVTLTRALRRPCPLGEMAAAYPKCADEVRTLDPQTRHPEMLAAGFTQPALVLGDATKAATKARN
jgi:hypothetical protein